jgi:hypothetical protein
MHGSPLTYDFARLDMGLYEGDGIDENSPSMTKHKHLSWGKRDVSYLSTVVDVNGDEQSNRKALAPLPLTPNRISLPTLKLPNKVILPGQGIPSSATKGINKHETCNVQDQSILPGQGIPSSAAKGIDKHEAHGVRDPSIFKHENQRAINNAQPPLPLEVTCENRWTDHGEKIQSGQREVDDLDEQNSNRFYKVSNRELEDTMDEQRWQNRNDYSYDTERKEVRPKIFAQAPKYGSAGIKDDPIGSDFREASMHSDFQYSEYSTYSECSAPLNTQQSNNSAYFSDSQHSLSNTQRSNVSAYSQNSQRSHHDSFREDLDSDRSQTDSSYWSPKSQSSKWTEHYEDEKPIYQYHSPSKKQRDAFVSMALAGLLFVQIAA